MTLPSDQNLHIEKLSPHAKRMLELREDVILEWGKRLRATVKEAQDLPHPILINTLPSLYANLTQAISPDYPRATSGQSNTISAEHGGERARLTNYNAQAVISEYQLLRWTIFDVLRINNVQLHNEEFTVINNSIDESIREAVSAFALAQSALRERFVAALTHDLRNPLAAANVAAELIRHFTDSPKIEELIGRITDNLTRMDSMIQELLDAVVFQSGERLRLHFDHFDMLELAREVCDQFTSIHGERFEVSGETVAGCWDRHAVKRAVENLVGNAVKYGLPESPIRVKVAAYHERMVLAVHNQGEPIAPEQLETVFQVFRRAATAKEGGKRGWGIGLPYVRSVAESHGGSVGVDSSLERGTTFSIDMPLDARPFQNAPTFGQTPQGF